MVLLVVISAIPLSAQEGSERPVIDPIRIAGNEELDAFFADASTDGLTPGTAHVLEGITIERSGEGDACVHIENTTRYLVIRECTISDGGPESITTAIELVSSSNITILHCDLPGSRKAIVTFECSNIDIRGNRLRDQSYVGIHVERTGPATVVGNDLDMCNESIIVYRGANVSVETNTVCDNKVGIRVTASRDTVVFDNEVKLSTDGGIKVQRSRRLVIEANYVHHNALAGIHVSDSREIDVLANHMEANYQGLYLFDTHESYISNNNATWNDVAGVRLSGSHDNRVEDNFVKSNWNYGVDLIRSDSNQILRNRIVSHERGIRLDGSNDNVIEK
ncbi:MAG: right-handed parallel beta-helix repeat-containing protein, partial [Thermoplasmata archaeon]